MTLAVFHVRSGPGGRARLAICAYAQSESESSSGSIFAAAAVAKNRSRFGGGSESGAGRVGSGGLVRRGRLPQETGRRRTDGGAANAVTHVVGLPAHALTHSAGRVGRPSDERRCRQLHHTTARLLSGADCQNCAQVRSTSQSARPSSFLQQEINSNCPLESCSCALAPFARDTPVNSPFGYSLVSLSQMIL